MTEKEAFRRQAFDDLKVFDVLLSIKLKVNRCHQLYYLQKATEKWRKAIAGGAVRYTHALLEPINRWMKPITKLRVKGKYADVKNVIANLEELVANGGQANTEYPWRKKNTENFIAPCGYEFPTVTPKDANFLANFLAEQLNYEPNNF